MDYDKNAALDFLRETRRYLHKNPEPSAHEYNTCEYICLQLSRFGFAPKKIMTGVICDIGRGKNRIALRADTDALKIEEKNRTDYKSENGYMHACGHDGHTANLLNVARILKDVKNPPPVRLIFQFGEEGEAEGAKNMIERGAIKDVSEIYALHLNPALQAGKIGICYGAMFAGAVEFDIKIQGRSSHAAQPQNGANALLTAAGAALALERIGKKFNTVCHAGIMNAGSARNIVASLAQMQCTVRYFETQKLDAVTMELTRELIALDNLYGTSHTVTALTSNPPLINHAYAVDKIKQVAGESAVTVAPEFTAEDFAHYLQDVTGAMIWLGVKDDKHCSPLHSDTFDFDEANLLLGTELFIKLIGL